MAEALGNERSGIAAGEDSGIAEDRRRSGIGTSRGVHGEGSAISNVAVYRVPAGTPLLTGREVADDGSRTGSALREAATGPRDRLGRGDVVGVRLDDTARRQDTGEGIDRMPPDRRIAEADHIGDDAMLRSLEAAKAVLNVEILHSGDSAEAVSIDGAEIAARHVAGPDRKGNRYLFGLIGSPRGPDLIEELLVAVRGQPFSSLPHTEAGLQGGEIADIEVSVLEDGSDNFKEERVGNKIILWQQLGVFEIDQ